MRNMRFVIFSSLKGTTYKIPPKRKHRQPVLSHRESCSLVAFVTLNRDLQSSENEWPAMNTENVYWTKASDFIIQNCYLPPSHVILKNMIFCIKE